jgi:16S rRNA (uracil1498-N3)-methyltransferase
MHRLLADTASLESECPALSDAALRHLKVIRPKDGERIELFDGRGSWREFTWRGSRLAASGEIRRASREGRRGLVLFACVTKGSRWDWTVEKATELGATRIVPVISERTIVRIPAEDRVPKRERWTRIAEDAARQSDAKFLPEVCAPVGFGEALSMAEACECYVGALVTPAPRDILSAVSSASHDGSRPLAVFVGPEGDFTPGELAALVKVASPVSLGPTVLRAETAAIYALGVLKAHLDSEAR